MKEKYDVQFKQLVSTMVDKYQNFNHLSMSNRLRDKFIAQHLNKAKEIIKHSSNYSAKLSEVKSSFEAIILYCDRYMNYNISASEFTEFCTDETNELIYYLFKSQESEFDSHIRLLIRQWLNNTIDNQEFYRVLSNKYVYGSASHNLLTVITNELIEVRLDKKNKTVFTSAFYNIRGQLIKEISNYNIVVNEKYPLVQ